MKERIIEAYDPFVIPYMIGLIFVLAYLVIAFLAVLKDISLSDRKKMMTHLVSPKIFVTIKDIFADCLLHIKIWKKNPLLGYMHSSIAFGWFMLIVVGHIEIFFYAPNRLNLPYYPIFFRYFVMETSSTVGGAFFFFLMDFFLLIVLSGIALALVKRLRRRFFGMRRTTKLKWNDLLGMYALWSIFPLRFLAESFTSPISGGGFLTETCGMLFSSFADFLTNEAAIRPIWWAYSIALMVFFLTLPWSRFTHILSEALLIYMRNAGIKESKKNNGYAAVEIYSCSRCGICLDPCQLVSSASLSNCSSVAFTRQTRWRQKNEALHSSASCLMCNRCVEACPVGVNSVELKLNTKAADIKYYYPHRYDYIDEVSQAASVSVASSDTSVSGNSAVATENSTAMATASSAAQADIIYFSGCMGHLTPKVEIAMQKIFREAGVKYLFLDEGGGVCCGRPMYLSGDKEGALQLIAKNTEKILSSGAKKLVTSCPICYKVFKEMYRIDGLEVLHHSEYILSLMEEGDITVRKSKQQAIYHSPCELGRNSGVYTQPIDVLNRTLKLRQSQYEGKDALCCGGSIAAEDLQYRKKRTIAKDAIKKMKEGLDEVDLLVTACPACKKAFVEANSIEVKDIAELVAAQLV